MLPAGAVRYVSILNIPWWLFFYSDRRMRNVLKYIYCAVFIHATGSRDVFEGETTLAVVTFDFDGLE